MSGSKLAGKQPSSQPVVSESEALEFWVPEWNLDKMKEQFANLNKELEGHGHADYEITGKAIRNTKLGSTLMYKVRSAGEFQVKQIRYLGRSVRATEKDHRLYSTINPNLSMEDFEAIKSHPLGCDCCKTDRNRNEMYYFKCTDDFTVGDAAFKKGEICSIGSSCVDKFVSKKARDIVETFAGKGLGEESGPHGMAHTYIDPVRFACYMDRVAVSHIDDVFQYVCKEYRDHFPDAFSVGNSKSAKKAQEFADAFATGSWSDADRADFAKIREEYGNPEYQPYVTYRKLSKQSKGYGCEGSISKTAKAIYMMLEHGYFEPSFFKNTAQAQILKDLCESYGITKSSVDSKMSEKCDAIKKVIQDGMKEKPECALDEINNLNLETMSDIIDSGLRINKDYSQFIVDIFDQKYLSVMQDARYHEIENPAFVTFDDYTPGEVAVYSKKPAQIEAEGDKKGRLPSWIVKNYDIKPRDAYELLVGGVVNLKGKYYRVTDNGRDSYLRFEQVFRDRIKYTVKNTRVALEESKMSETFNPDGFRISFAQDENPGIVIKQNRSHPAFLNVKSTAILYQFDEAQGKKVPAYALAMIDMNDKTPARIDIKGCKLCPNKTGYGILISDPTSLLKVDRTVEKNGVDTKQTEYMTCDQINAARSKVRDEYHRMETRSAQSVISSSDQVDYGIEFH